MKYILPCYVLKEWFRAFIPAFCGFGFLIILGLTIQLLHKGLDIIDIRVIIPHLMLFACPDTLPISFLAAAVMTYGRLSANNEIAAIRTSGIHLHVIVTPVIVISLLLTFLTLYLNAEVLPKSNRKIKLLKETAVSSILSRRISTVKKKIIFEPYHIYIGKVEDNSYKNLAIIEYFKDFVTNILMAEEGTIVMSDDGHSLVLTLKNGDFAKMDYAKPSEIPRVGTFDEMSFEIPVNKNVVTASNKYKSLIQLYKEMKAVNVEMEKYMADLNYKEKSSEISKKELRTFRQRYNGLIEEQERNAQKLEILGNSIAGNKSRSENIEDEIDTLENHIAVSNIDIEHFERASGDSEKELAQIKEGIEDYLQEKKSKEKELTALRDTISASEKEWSIANAHAVEIKEQTAELESGSTKLLNFSKFEKMRENANELLILIHKKLSSSFLCITFALIGIPLGILTKSGNILISFGASFLLVILVYYPLSVVGVIFAKDLLPAAPAIWSANGIITILGIVLFRKSLVK